MNNEVIEEACGLLISYHMQTDPRFRQFMKDRFACSDAEIEGMLKHSKEGVVVR